MNPGAEWTRYRRAPELGVEAMAARFVSHAYQRHAHDTYSFGVTDQGAQAFRCRGASHVSHAGQVMTFNPDDPHDGHAGGPGGFTYRMVHITPEVVREVCGQRDGVRGLPLFRDPVVDDPVLALRVRRAAAALLDAAGPLAVQEAVDALVVAATGHATARYASGSRNGPGGRLAAARDLLHEGLAGPVSADDLARATGASRFAVYRDFQRRYGMSPSAYLRQVRLRAARRALAAGEPAAAAAVAAGFADQAHLTRWFRRAYGITPAQYQRAGVA